MLKTIALILPVLIPSWRFFKAIDPSPRVEWALLDTKGNPASDWQEFRPRPKHVSPMQMLTRLFWNPERNDALFVVSCAERIEQQPTEHSIREIQRRILTDVGRLQLMTADSVLQFRLVFVHRGETGLSSDTVYLSDPFQCGAVA